MKCLTYFFVVFGVFKLANATEDDHCKPTQECWPELSVWQDFNNTIDGNLEETHPYF